MNSRFPKTIMVVAALVTCLVLIVPCIALADDSLAPYPHDDGLVDPLAPFGKRANDYTWSERDEIDALAALAEAEEGEEREGVDGEDAGSEGAENDGAENEESAEDNESEDDGEGNADGKGSESTDGKDADDKDADDKENNDGGNDSGKDSDDKSADDKDNKDADSKDDDGKDSKDSSKKDDKDGKDDKEPEEPEEPEPEPIIAEWKRLAGDNALVTMAKIAQEGFASAHTVVIAASSGYWDALSASSIAGVSGAPVLLTTTEALSPQTEAQVKRLKPQRAIICGGTDSVSAAVEERLKAIGVKTIERYSGENAAETAAAIGEQVGMSSSPCIIATVTTYHDALSIAPYAYAHQVPIYLTNLDGELSDDTIAAIEKIGYKQAIIVGGTASVKPEVEDQLEAAGIEDYERFAGPNAYATSSHVATWAIDEGLLSVEGIGVACGTGYWDALTGAALCGMNGSVLVLADDYNYSTAVCIINEYSGTFAQGYLFGGTDSVGVMTEQKIASPTLLSSRSRMSAGAATPRLASMSPNGSAKLTSSA